MSESTKKRLKAANKLAKWRAVFAGWQLGTRAKGDPESDAVRDHRENTLMTRVEVNALTNLLADKGIITLDEFNEAFVVEAEEMEHMLEGLFPGFRSSHDGMVIDPKVAAETTKRWRP